MSGSAADAFAIEFPASADDAAAGRSDSVIHHNDFDPPVRRPQQAVSVRYAGSKFLLAVPQDCSLPAHQTSVRQA